VAQNQALEKKEKKKAELANALFSGIGGQKKKQSSDDEESDESEEEEEAKKAPSKQET